MRSDFFYPIRVITRAEEIAATGLLGFVVGVLIFFPIFLVKAIIDLILSIIIPRKYIKYAWMGAIAYVVLYFYFK
jgi:hypothetical protein